jgi:hypothetical protein
MGPSEQNCFVMYEKLSSDYLHPDKQGCCKRLIEQDIRNTMKSQLDLKSLGLRTFPTNMLLIFSKNAPFSIFGT